MNKRIKIAFSIIVLILLTLSTLSIASAMTVKSVEATNFQPGSQQEITIEVKNTLDDDTEDVSLTLDLSKLPFTIIDSDSDDIEISSDDTEGFDFTIKASSEAKAGDYQIPYTLSYKNNETTAVETKTGTFSLTIEANPELVYTVSTEKAIVGSQGKITLKIVNKGLGDAKFVDVKIVPEGYTLLSEAENYVGTVSSDDSQTASFDVIFKDKNPTLTAQVEYKDFNNEKTTKTVTLPLTVYSTEEALALGIIKPDNTPVYMGIGIVIFAGWMIVRKIRKKKRINKAQGK
ncbi:MAG: hypothetical protein PHQ66_00410 [Candidatus Nanoarchaeia archaeon]|nr:hypothetical protein [Candidatus Nanoarchaeia archaeon]MDD5358091.1 hypothetical protein [Candidatus Nanoarchaeia archaeon]MDD5589279.1 hypothetical protein [Candidatus Nanoarchaeia archaeon]